MRYPAAGRDLPPTRLRLAPGCDANGDPPARRNAPCYAQILERQPGYPLTDITATRAIERIWRGGIACDRHAFVASAAEAEQLDAFDAQVAKVVAAVRERWSS